MKLLHTYTVKLTIAWNAGVKRPAENAPARTQAKSVIQNTLKCGAYQCNINNKLATYNWVELERILTLTASHLDRSEGRMGLAQWKDRRHQKKMLMLSSRSKHNPTTEMYLYASVHYIMTISVVMEHEKFELWKYVQHWTEEWWTVYLVCDESNSHSSQDIKQCPSSKDKSHYTWCDIELNKRVRSLGKFWQ